MKKLTEWDFGYATAQWMNEHGEPVSAVDIEDTCHGTVDIPEQDYIEMVDYGIDTPEPRAYWTGFNAYFAEA